MGIERGGEGFSELGGGASEIVADTVKGPLSMVFQDGSAVVFPKNFSPIQESGVVLGGNAALVSTQEGSSGGLVGEDPLSNKDFTKLTEFSRFLGMRIEDLKKKSGLC